MGWVSIEGVREIAREDEGLGVEVVGEGGNYS